MDHALVTQEYPGSSDRLRRECSRTSCTSGTRRPRCAKAGGDTIVGRRDGFSRAPAARERLTWL